MAYKQSGLKNIGDIRGKILKGKNNTSMSTQEMKDVVSERLRQDMTGPQSIRQVRNSKVQDVTITPGSPGKAGYIPEGTGTSMKDIGYKSQRSYESKQRRRADRSNKMKESVSKVGKGLKYGAVELGHTVLDKLPLAGMTVGKRRVFVGDESGTQDYLFGKLTGFNEEKGHYKRHPSMMASGQGIKVKHFDRMTNKEWRAEKKKRYTKKERLKNLTIKGSGKIAKGLFGVAAAIGYDNSGFGTEKGKKPGQWQKSIKNKVKSIF